MSKGGGDGKRGEATRLIHAGSRAPEGLVRTVGPPIQKGSTVLVPDAASLYDPHIVSYGRQGLTAHRALSEALSVLEGGVHTELYSSGLAALTGAMMAVLGSGDEVLVVDCIYAPTRRFCETMLKRFGVATRYFPARATPDEVMAMVTPATRLIVLESPGSLTFEIQDIPAIAAAARARNVLTAIDNTYGAGLYYKPLSLGVDLSVQALTKYVGGHSDVFMGSVAVADETLAAKLKASILQTGWAVTPEDAYAMLRGLRTLETRLARHQASGLEIAKWLQGQPQVSRVLHPALPDFPDHALWKRDFTGANGLFSLVMKGGSDRNVHAFLDVLEIFGLGFSWGGFESLAIDCHPQLVSSRSAERWTAEGPVIRLHVGLEDPSDLIADLRIGLDAFAQTA